MGSKDASLPGWAAGREGAVLRAMWMLAGVVIALAACSPRHSGVYVAHDSRAVAMIQLVESKDGALSGRMEQVALDDAGEATSRSMPLEGEVDGGIAVLRPKGFLESASFTGQFKAGRLVLSNDGSSQTFSKQDIRAFEREVQKLKKHGLEIAEARRIEEGRASVRHAAQLLDELDRATPEVLARIRLTRERLEQVNEAGRKAEQLASDLQRLGQPVEAGRAQARVGALLAERERVASMLAGLRGAVNAKAQKAMTHISRVRPICTAAVRPRHLDLCHDLEAQDERLRRIASTLKPEFEAAARAYGGQRAAR